MATSQPAKKAVVESTAEAVDPKATWQPAPEDRAKANKFRLIAALFWVVAIAIECVVIFRLLLVGGVTTTQADTGAETTSYPFFGAMLSQNAYFAWILALIVVCGVLAVIGSQFWKKANALDPASEKNKVRFFVQNQLGAIISMIAFIPLVILVLMNKNLKGNQKVIASIVAILVLAGATFASYDYNSPSVEQYGDEQALVMAYNEAVNGTATDVVYWVKGSKVYHLCSDASVLNLSSKDPYIYSGPVGKAHGAGMNRLTLQTECDFNPSTNTIVSTGQVLELPARNTPTPTDSPT